MKTYKFESVVAWQKAHQLSRDLGFVSIEQYEDLYSKLEDASRMLMLYCEGIVNNNALNG